MDAQPHFTRARARAARPEDDDPAPRQLSLRQSILGPPPASADGNAASTVGDGFADLPATPPPTQAQPFVQPAWILPRPNGEAAVRARDAIRASRSRTQVSASPPQLNAPADHPSRPPSAAFGSPMAQEPANSDDEWFGVAASALYEPNDAYATSGEEGSGRHIHSRPRSTFSSPGDDDFHRLPPPVELSPSGELVFLHRASARGVPASFWPWKTLWSSLLAWPPQSPSAGAYMRPHEVLSGIPPLLQSRNFPTLPGACNQLRLSMSTVEPLVPNEAVLMSLPGGLALVPGLVNPLLAQTLELIFVVPLAPFLRSLIMLQLGSTAPPSGRAVTASALPTAHTPCILCRMHRTFEPWSKGYR
ncbi:hypothetical protein EV359DRAFT_68905 [Lentinula novae-zelandiae]|nr:hypothetical protein EV359DRAFT_68905 [Lentinula novae-zelandiae]